MANVWSMPINAIKTFLKNYIYLKYVYTEKSRNISMSVYTFIILAFPLNFCGILTRHRHRPENLAAAAAAIEEEVAK
jgi:hypothetical protein